MWPTVAPIDTSWHTTSTHRLPNSITHLNLNPPSLFPRGPDPDSQTWCAFPCMPLPCSIQLTALSRLSWPPQSVRGAGKLSSPGSFVRCSDPELRPFLLHSRSSQTLGHSIQQWSKTMCDLCTSRWTNCTWSSSPIDSPTSFKTLTPCTSSRRLLQAPARP